MGVHTYICILLWQNKTLNFSWDSNPYIIRNALFMGTVLHNITSLVRTVFLKSTFSEDSISQKDL